jgi:hypothetical protein
MGTYQPKPIDAEESFSRDEMEAALCLWEAMLELREKLPRLDAEFDAHGQWAMRQAAIALAPHSEQVWQVISDNGNDDTVTYDWEFCPEYISVWAAADCQKLEIADCVAKVKKGLGR